MQSTRRERTGARKHAAPAFSLVIPRRQARDNSQRAFADELNKKQIWGWPERGDSFGRGADEGERLQNSGTLRR